MRGFLKLAVALAAVAPLAFPAASGATVTIGSSMAAAGDSGIGCTTPPCTRMQTALPGRMIESPVNGTITTWRAKTNGPGGTLIQLRVVRPMAGANIFLASGAIENPMGTTGLVQFSTALSISKGDRIAVNETAGGANLLAQSAVAGATGGYWDPGAPNGTAPPPNIPADTNDFLINADIEPTNTLGSVTQKKLKNGSVKITTDVPNPGTLQGASAGGKSSGGAYAAASKLVKSASKTAAAAGQLSLKLKPTKKTKAKLREKGKAKGRVALTFTPDFGTAATQTIKVKLKLG